MFSSGVITKLFLIALVTLLNVNEIEATSRPIIGIIAQPSSSTLGSCGGDCQNIPAGYVKFIEQAGGRVVPINYAASDDDIDELFPQLNGVLITGGGSALTPSGQRIFDLTVAATDGGEHVPLWGTCMGFQWLLMAATHNTSIIDGIFDSYNLSLPLEFTDAARSSRLFGAASPSMMHSLASEAITFNSHQYGIFPDHFAATPELSSFFTVLSTNTDRAGLPFVSTMEAVQYPIYGVQWHPEKNAFEWGLSSDGTPHEDIDHSSAAVSVSQYLASFLVDEARRNDRRFASQDEEDARLIYNYPKTKTGPSNVETYFFDNDFK